MTLVVAPYFLYTLPFAEFPIQRKFLKIKRMIIDKTNGRLAEIKAFAKEHDLMESFNETFSRLETYSAKGNDVSLYSDFAPLSLEFSISDQGRFVFNGGFIFHGKHDGFGNGGAPTFSVSLSTENKTGWSIHT
jgi:hypothetical protein